MHSDFPADHVRQFAALLAGTDIEQLELRTAQGALVVRRSGGAATALTAPQAVTPPSAKTTAVVSPSLGTFLHRHPLHDVAFVTAGDAVRAHQIVGLLRIGSLLLPVTAPRDGVVAAVAAAHGDIVGYGETLIRLRQNWG